MVITITSTNHTASLSGFGEGGDESVVTIIEATTDAGENTFIVTNRGKSVTNFSLTVTIK